MDPREWFRGLPIVARQEFVGNVRSVRFLIMAFVTALVIVGGSYGFSGLGGGLFQGPAVNVWTHPAYAADGSHVAVAWVSDPFGNRVVGATVVFEEPETPTAGRQFAEATTDADGFARADAGNLTFVFVTARQGFAEAGSSIQFFPRPPLNFTMVTAAADLDSDGFVDDLGIHVVDLTGDPAAARILVNGTERATADARGYARVDLGPGTSNVTVEIAGESETFPWTAFEVPVVGGPDVTLAIIAGGFGLLFMPIFAIVISFDAVSKERVQGTLDLLLSRPASRTGILLGKFLGSFAAVSKERVQGTLDLLLSRPASRTGILLGKFLGSFAAVALPVTLVNLAGIAVIGAATGESPTGGFALAFVGLSLLLIAYFVLLQLILSTLAKTSGTAVLFGVLAWLVFNLLYNIIVLLISLPFDPQTRFQIQQAATLGNPSLVYQNLVFAAAPGDLFGGFGGTTLSPGALGVAAVFWFVFLLALALWTFHKKAAE